MSMRQAEILDALFDRVRALERGEKSLSREEKTFDEIFRQLRELREKADELDRWRWKIIGIATGAGAVASAILDKIS